MNKVYKKYLMPMLAVALCVIMAVTCVAVAFTMRDGVGMDRFPFPEQPMVSNTSGGLELPSDHDIRKVDEGMQLPIGKVPDNYNNQSLDSPLEITDKEQLKNWLSSDNNSDRDAKLMNDISYDWDHNVAAAAMICYGRVLDGYGYTITYNGGGSNISPNADGALTEVSYFVKEIAGTMQNVTFTVPSGKDFIVNYKHAEQQLYSGFLCVNMSSGATMNNVKVNFGAKIGKTTGSCAGVNVGVIAARNAGIMNYCDVNIGGMTVIGADGGSNAKFGAYGAYGYIDSSGATINNCYMNFNSNVNAFNGFGDADKDDIAAGIFSDASYARINNFIVKDADIPYVGTHSKWHYFVGGTNGQTVVKNVYLLNNAVNLPTAETAYGIVRVATQLNYDLEWDRSISDRIVVKNKMLDIKNIFWDISQVGGKSYSDLYRYALTCDTMISLPAYTPNPIAVGGSLFSIACGEVGVRDSIQFTSEGITTSVDPTKPNVKINSAVYTGRKHTLSATFKSITNERWDDQNCFDIYYKGILTEPVMPGMYISTVQANAGSAPEDVALFAYFDAVNRRVVFRDDNYTSNNYTLTITKGATDIISRKVGKDDYIDKKWTASPIMVNLAVVGIDINAPLQTRPNTIRTTFSTAQQQKSGEAIEWVDVYRLLVEAGISMMYVLERSCSDLPIRFALFSDDTQLTEISEESIFSQVDTTIPTFEFDGASDGGVLDKWMDRYNADGNLDDNNEVAQIWIKTETGTSGISLYASARKMGTDGVYGDPTPWGSLTYQPRDNGSLIDSNIFAQKMYDPEKSREQNAQYFNGTWQVSFSGVNGAGVAAKNIGTDKEVITITAKVDYSDYKLSTDSIKRVWHGSNLGGGSIQELQKDVCDINIQYGGGREYFFRNEAMKYKIVAKEMDGDVGYTLARANGIDIPKANKFEYTASYSHDKELPIGTQPSIAVELKKLVKGSLGEIGDREYGNLPPSIGGNVTMPEQSHDGIVLQYAFEQTITNSKGLSVSLDDKKLPIGVYDIAIVARVNTDDSAFNDMCNAMYDLDVQGRSYTITKKPITIDYNRSTLMSSLRNFDAKWIKFADFSAQLVDGDIVVVKSIFPAKTPQDGDLVNGSLTVECFTTLNNENYTVVNTCNVTLTNFLTDSEDPTIFLLETPSDILAIKGDMLMAKFKLTADIDFKSQAFNGLGVFSGTLDGNGYAIKNIKIISDRGVADSKLNIGLFSAITSGATVKNLVISNMILDVKASAATTINMGGLAGTANGATVDNVSIQGSFYAMGAHKDTAAGVMFGRASKVTINNSMTFATIYFLKAINNTDKQPIKGGGIAGVLTDSKLSNVIAINQGYINSTLASGAGYIAAEQFGNTIASDVWYMKDSILSSGVVLVGDEGNAKVYADFLNVTTKFGQIHTPTLRGGVTFKDIMMRIIPLGMRANGLERLQVSNYKDLVILLHYNFADYKIMKDIYCFDGFAYSGTYKFAGNISNADGYKVHASNGDFEIHN